MPNQIQSPQIPIFVVEALELDLTFDIDHWRSQDQLTWLFRSSNAIITLASLEAQNLVL